MIYVHGWRSHSNLLYACVIIKIFYSLIANFAYWARVNVASCVSASIVIAKKCTTMRRTTLGVIRAPLRVHCVVTHLLAHATILYVARLSNKTAINRMVHAAHTHISFDVSLLYTPTVMDSWLYIWEIRAPAWDCSRFDFIGMWEAWKIFNHDHVFT